MTVLPARERLLFQELGPSEAGTVLVVDDVPETLRLAESLLGTRGYQVITATDGNACIKAARGNLPDLILLDFSMPGMGGLAVCGLLKKEPLTQKIPVIFLSAENELSHVVDAFERGAADYILKPFREQELLARVGTQMRLINTARNLATSYEQVRMDLQDAAKYMRALLPDPLNGAVRASWLFEPATTLGGDSFGYHWIDPDHFAFYLLDVCGHGVASALLAASATNLIRSGRLGGTEVYRNPARVLGRLNESFQPRAAARRFFSMWYGVMQLSESILVYSSAGHHPGLLKRMKCRGLEQLEGRGGCLLGIGLPSCFENCQVPWTPESDIYLFSDGAFEIRTPTGARLAFEDFQALVEKVAWSDGEGLQMIYDESQKRHGNGSLEDDFALLKVSR